VAVPVTVGRFVASVRFNSAMNVFYVFRCVGGALVRSVEDVVDGLLIAEVAKSSHRGLCMHGVSAHCP
jgi:hypothetical protein